MPIEQLARVGEQAAITPQTLAKPAADQKAERAQSTLAADNADKFVRSEDTFSPAYTKKSIQKKNVEYSREREANGKVQLEKDLAAAVEKIITRQHTNLSHQDLQLAPIGGSAEKDEDWSADHTAHRILDYAKYLVGGEPENADFSRKAFIAGFYLAELSAGAGRLSPECYKTHDKTMQLLQDWELGQ